MWYEWIIIVFHNWFMYEVPRYMRRDSVNKEQVDHERLGEDWTYLWRSTISCSWQKKMNSKVWTIASIKMRMIKVKVYSIKIGWTIAETGVLPLNSVRSAIPVQVIYKYQLRTLVICNWYESVSGVFKYAVCVNLSSTVQSLV